MGPDAYPMIPVAEALARVLAAAETLAPVVVALEEALGLVAAEPIRAAHPLPPFPASVKDGYAVVATDGAGVFPLAGSVTAGREAEFVLQPGQVAYITTGAPLPPGADAVVQVEDTARVDHARAAVEIRKAARSGQDVRPVGYDVALGQVVVEAGAALEPAELGLAATVGAHRVRVFPRPRVGVLSTGDELAPADAPLDTGQIHDSNGPMLRAAVARAGGAPINLGIARDNLESLHVAFADALARCDLIISTGGVSMGELDLMRALVEQTGTVHFGRLLLKPGKPCTFATVAHPTGTKLVFGLPGNPVSSLVTFYLLVLPAIQRLAGRANPGLPRTAAVLAHSVTLDPARPEYHRARLTWEGELHGGAGGWVATSTGNQASSRLLSLAGANALLELPQGAGELAAGTRVTALVIA